MAQGELGAGGWRRLKVDDILASTKNTRPKIIFVVTEDWAFLSHRLPMAHAAKDMGLDVLIATRVTEHRDAIERRGFRVAPIPFDRGNMNPFGELRAIIALVRLFWRERPDIIHNIALKPVIDSTFAARFAPVGDVINIFSGMGSVFIGENSLFRRFLIGVIRRLSHAHKVHSVVQNKDDLALLQELAICTPERLHMIRGSGVSLQEFKAHEDPSGSPVVTMIGRLLLDKGVREFVAAAEVVKKQKPEARFILAGDPDPANPKSISGATLEQWRSMGIVEFPGRITGAARLWAESHIAVLPSYREGLPKSLLEASAVGRAMITTDAPGCRELVTEKINGMLVPVGDSQALAKAILYLIDNPSLRQEMGKAARAIVEKDFSDQIVAQETQALYKAVLGWA